MAVGVPETDVFDAADAILARGERPTVERVRLELGRGSPARIGVLLDQWWARLAERLNGRARLPRFPTEVSQALLAVWQHATHQAHCFNVQTLSEQRQVLPTERKPVSAAKDQARQLDSDASQAEQHVSETRLLDLELLLEQRAKQILELQQQRDTLLRECREAQKHNEILHQELMELRLKT